MNRHIEKAKELRSPEKCYNCAETIMMAYADDLGLSETQAECLGCNFGGGMKRWLTSVILLWKDISMVRIVG